MGRGEFLEMTRAAGMAAPTSRSQRRREASRRSCKDWSNCSMEIELRLYRCSSRSKLLIDERPRAFWTQYHLSQVESVGRYCARSGAIPKVQRRTQKAAEDLSGYAPRHPAGRHAKVKSADDLSNQLNHPCLETRRNRHTCRYSYGGKQ